MFYRKIKDDEIPLELNLIWSLNYERKSLVLTDHDPNEAHFVNFEFDQLEKKLEKLNTEEEKALKIVNEKYEDMRKSLMTLISLNKN